MQKVSSKARFLMSELWSPIRSTCLVPGNAEGPSPCRHYRLVANIRCIQTAMCILKSLVLQSRPFPEECSELTSIILWFCWHFFILFPLTFLLYVQSIIASFSCVIIFTYHQRWTLYYYLTVFLGSQIFQTSTLCITEDQVAPGLKSQQCPYWKSIPLWPFH